MEIRKTVGPCKGSAPDIHGQNISNPLVQIWSAAMMLDQLGHKNAGDTIVRTIERVLREGPHTPDTGGKASTQDLVKAIASAI